MRLKAWMKIKMILSFGEFVQEHDTGLIILTVLTNTNHLSCHDSSFQLTACDRKDIVAQSFLPWLTNEK